MADTDDKDPKQIHSIVPHIPLTKIDDEGFQVGSAEASAALIVSGRFDGAAGPSLNIYTDGTGNYLGVK